VPLTIMIGAAALLAMVISVLLLSAIGHGPAGAWRLFRNGGWIMYLILLADVVAPILIAVLGAFVVRGKRMPAGVLFVCAAVPFALALFGAWLGQTMVLRAVSGESVDPEQRARILAEGVAEAMSTDIFGGLVACGAAIVATLAASSAAAAIDTALATRGERSSSLGAIGAGACGAVWLFAALVIGVLRLKSAGGLVMVPALPVLVIVPFAVLAGRGAAAVRGWHDRAEGSRVAGGLLVAGASALLALLALQRGIEASFTSRALEAISGESIDPSQRLRILAEAVDAGRLAPASYAVHGVLGTATFGFAIAPAIGGGKHPATPSAVLAVVLGLLLLGGALLIGRERASIPRALDEAAQAWTPGGVALPAIVTALSDKRSGSAYGARLVITKDGLGEGPPSSTTAGHIAIFADKAATIGMVRGRLPQSASSEVTFVTVREHPLDVEARVGYLAGYLGRTGYVSATIDDDGPKTSALDTLHVVTVSDDAVEIEGKRYSYPLPQVPDDEGIAPSRRNNVHYVFRSADSVERAMLTIAGVEKLRARDLWSRDLDRTITVDDPSRPRKPKPESTGLLGLGALGGIGEPFGGSKSSATLREGVTSVNGRLPPEVIQRIARGNYGRLRLCYEDGLRNNPKLAGRVKVKFVIDRTGAVQTAVDGGSDLSDKGVVACVVRHFGNLTFPAPERGIVTVVYPIEFSPAAPR